MFYVTSFSRCTFLNQLPNYRPSHCLQFFSIIINTPRILVHLFLRNFLIFKLKIVHIKNLSKCYDCSKGCAIYTPTYVGVFFLIPLIILVNTFNYFISIM